MWLEQIPKEKTFVAKTRRLLRRYFKSSNTLIGIDISGLYFRLVALKKNKRGFLVDFISEEVLESNPFSVAAKGKIIHTLNANLFSETFKKLADGYNIRGKPTVISMPEELIFRQFIPEIDSSEIKIKNEFPYDEDDLYIRNKIIQSKFAGKTHKDLIVTAIARQILDYLYEASYLADLTPYEIESESDSLIRLISYHIPVSQIAQIPILILNIGLRRTAFMMFVNGAARFIRVIEFGMEVFNFRLAMALKISLAESEKTSKEKGIMFDQYPVGAQHVLKESLDILIKEVMEMREFYRSHITHEHGFQPIQFKHIIIVGEGADMKGLKNYLSLAAGLNLIDIDIWKNLEHNSTLQYDLSSRFAVAVGAALYKN